MKQRMHKLYFVALKIYNLNIKPKNLTSNKVFLSLNFGVKPHRTTLSLRAITTWIIVYKKEFTFDNVTADVCMRHVRPYQKALTLLQSHVI